MDEWREIETASKDGSPVYCRWPGYNRDVAFHEGYCLWKRDWYTLGKPVEIEGWWCVGGGLPAKDPTHWHQ